MTRRRYDYPWWCSDRLLLALQTTATIAFAVVAITGRDVAYLLIAIVWATLAASTWLGIRRDRHQTPD